MTDQVDPSIDARRAVAEMAELAGGLAHELRNPLSTMMINLKLLAEDLQDDSAHDADVRRRAIIKVDVLRQEAERLQGLFDDFLDLTGPRKLHAMPVDARTIVDRLVRFIDPMARRHGIELEVAAGDRPILCDLDENLMDQALLNIAINAKEAMPDGGRLRIEASDEGDAVVIAVSDTGTGISEAVRDRIGRPFFSTKPRGTGLGLSITRRIVEEHGGTLGIDSEPGRGTAVTIRIPRSTADGASPGDGDDAHPRG